jgi:polysaccharide biosynthesis transport protein
MRDDLKRVVEEEEPEKGVAVERLRSAWGRRKWLAVLVFAFPFAAAASVIFSLPPLYKSTVLVLVDRQQVPEVFVRPTVTSELETRLQTISQEILSRARLEALITRFGLYPGLRKEGQNEEVVEQMRKEIKLELKTTDTKGQGHPATTAFALSYRGPDAQTVALVTNTLASFYIEENLKVRERQATGTADFLKVQLAETRNRLDEL